MSIQGVQLIRVKTFLKYYERDKNTEQKVMWTKREGLETLGK